MGVSQKKPKAKWEPCCICGKVSRNTKYHKNGKKYCNRHLPKK